MTLRQCTITCTLHICALSLAAVFIAALISLLEPKNPEIVRVIARSDQVAQRGITSLVNAPDRCPTLAPQHTTLVAKTNFARRYSRWGDESGIVSIDAALERGTNRCGNRWPRHLYSIAGGDSLERLQGGLWDLFS